MPIIDIALVHYITGFACGVFVAWYGYKEGYKAGESDTVNNSLLETAIKNACSKK